MNLHYNAKHNAWVGPTVSETPIDDSLGGNMALAQFRNDPKGINISKRLGAPKKMTMEAWFKATRKLIPQIPNPKDTDWQITHEHADRQWIKFEMHNSVGERCYVIIDRLQPFIGGI